jgi:hypothetical protein
MKGNYKMNKILISAALAAFLIAPSFAFAKCDPNIPNLPSEQPIADTLVDKGAKMPNQRALVYEMGADNPSAFYVIFQNKKSCKITARQMSGQQIFDQIGISGFVEGDEPGEVEGE